MSQFKSPQPPIRIFCEDEPTHLASTNFECSQPDCICHGEQEETQIDLGAIFRANPGALSRHHHVFERKRVTAKLDPTPTQPLEHPQELPIIGSWYFDTDASIETQRQIDAWFARLRRWFLTGKQ